MHYIENKESSQQDCKEYYNEHREKLLEKAKKYQEEHSKLPVW